MADPRYSASLPPYGTTSPTSSASRLWGGASQSPFMRRTQRASWNPIRPTLGQPPVGVKRPGGMLADVRTSPPDPQPPATQPAQNAQSPTGSYGNMVGGGTMSPTTGGNGLPPGYTVGMPVAPGMGGVMGGTYYNGQYVGGQGGMLGGGAGQTMYLGGSPGFYNKMSLGQPQAPIPTGGAGNPIPESWLNQLRQNTTGYINSTLGNQGGAYSPEVMNSMRDQIAKRMQAAGLSAAGNQGTLGSSVLARNMSQEVGDALARLEMENQSQGLSARQNAAQLGQGMFFGGTGDLMRQQEIGGNLQSQNLNDYLRWQQLQNEMYWRPKEFAYNAALNDATRQAGADAGQTAMYGNLLESGLGMLGYANAPQYQYNPYPATA